MEGTFVSASSYKKDSFRHYPCKFYSVQLRDIIFVTFYLNFTMMNFLSSHLSSCVPGVKYLFSADLTHGFSALRFICNVDPTGHHSTTSTCYNDYKPLHISFTTPSVPVGVATVCTKHLEPSVLHHQHKATHQNSDCAAASHTKKLDHVSEDNWFIDIHGLSESEEKALYSSWYKAVKTVSNKFDIADYVICGLTDDEQTKLYESWNVILRRYSPAVNACPPTFFTSHNKDTPRRVLFTIFEKEESHEEDSLSDCYSASSPTGSFVSDLEIKLVESTNEKTDSVNSIFTGALEKETDTEEDSDTDLYHNMNAQMELFDSWNEILSKHSMDTYEHSWVMNI